MENQRKKLESRKFFEKKLGNREPSREKNRKKFYEQIKKIQQKKFSKKNLIKKEKRKKT